MGLCKLMKRRKPSAPKILSLPNDILASILASAASSSKTIIDLVNAKLTCKEFNEAAEDNLVFQRVSLETIGSLNWKLSPGASSFLEQCEGTGNPNALYKRGLIAYFSRQELELGRELLKKSSDLGHADATYALGIILFSDESSKHQGTELLAKLEIMGMSIEKCRRRYKKILKEMWINCKELKREFTATCLNTTCRNGGMRGRPKKEEWSWNGKYEYESFCCESCKWSYELKLFCDILSGA